MAGELSKVADIINWPRIPDPKEFEGIADHIIVTVSNGMEELMDTLAADSTQLRRVSAVEKPGWVRLMRKMVASKAPPAGAGQEKVTA